MSGVSFLERASLLRKLILRGGLKSRGNRRCAASGGRSEPVSRKRRCLWFSKGHKQQCRDGVHPTKVPLASIPLPANNRKCCIFFVNAKQKEVQTRCLCLNTRSVFLTIEAGIPRIAVDNLWNTGRQVRGPTFSEYSFSCESRRLGPSAGHPLPAEIAAQQRHLHCILALRDGMW